MANAKRALSPTSKNPVSTRILELLHTDLAGPYAVTNFNDKRYVLKVLDDYTKLSSFKCLKHKDDVAAALIHICNSLENQCRDMDGSPRIKAARSDNGNEYINKDVKAYFSSKGIDQQTTGPYNPQSNGSAECLNIVIRHAPCYQPWRRVLVPGCGCFQLCEEQVPPQVYPWLKNTLCSVPWLQTQHCSPSHLWLCQLPHPRPCFPLQIQVKRGQGSLHGV
jgi:hypothetical protein